MLIDEKGKLFGKISIVDITIILIVIVALSAGVYKFSNGKLLGNSDGNEKFIIEFYSEEAPDFAVESIEVNETMSDYEKGAKFGKILSIKKEKAKSIGMTSSGEYVLSSRPGYMSSRIIVEGEGQVSKNGGVTIDNIDYMIGKTVILKAGDTVFVARIYDFKKKGE